MSRLLHWQVLDDDNRKSSTKNKTEHEEHFIHNLVLDEQHYVQKLDKSKLNN